MELERILAPRSIAVVGLSADATKHGGRALANLRKVGFSGHIVGVNRGLPDAEGVEIHATLDDLEESPDLVVCATPGPVATEVVAAASAGAGGVIVFAPRWLRDSPTPARSIVCWPCRRLTRPRTRSNGSS